MAKSLKLFLVACISVSVFAHVSRAEPSHTSFFNSQWLNAVVSIDIPSPNDQQKYLHVGTGFLVRSVRSHTVLVTAKHVVADASLRKLLVYRVASGKGSTI